jgi:hypothetical protein
MTVAEKILEKKLFEFYRPDFPSDERAMRAVKTSRVMLEEKEPFLAAMKEIADMAWRDGYKRGKSGFSGADNERQEFLNSLFITKEE